MCCDSTVECCGFDVLRRFNDPIVQADLKLLPYQVVCVDGDKPCVSVEWKEQTRILTTEEISAMILSRMKETAEAYLGALLLRVCAHSDWSFYIYNRRSNLYLTRKSRAPSFK
jgi:hypothetical protein